MRRTCDALGMCQRRDPACAGCDCQQREAAAVRTIGRDPESHLDDATVRAWIDMDSQDDIEFLDLVRRFWALCAVIAVVLIGIGALAARWVMS